MRSATAALPVVICTGALRQVEELEGHLKALGVEVVLKPLHIEGLLGAVRRALAARDAPGTRARIPITRGSPGGTAGRGHARRHAGGVLARRPTEEEARMATAHRPEDFGIGRLFWVMREAAIVADVDTGRIVLWNPAAEALLGYPAAEARGLDLAALVPARLRAAHRAGLARYRATGHGRLVDSGAPAERPPCGGTGPRCRSS